MLEVKNMTVQYRYGAFAVNNLSFSLQKGDFLTVYGDKESGKTTLLKALCGLVPLKEGTVYLDGKDLLRIPPHERNICLVHEDGGFFEHKSVRYNLEYPLKIRGEKLRENDLRFVSPSLLTKMVKKLSHEERVALCMERLSFRREGIFLLDDPFRDEKLLEKYDGFLRELTQKGIVVFATGSVREAERFPNDIMLLSYGYMHQRSGLDLLYGDPNSLTVLKDFGKDYVAEESLLSEKEDKIAVTVAGKEYVLPKHSLLNEIYIGDKVIAVLLGGKVILFDSACEQRITF